MAKRLAHGGNLDIAIRQFGIPRDQWLDLSTGINPVPYPIGKLSSSVWSRLPELNAETALLSKASAYYKLPASAKIVISPGTQALIQWLPRLILKSKVFILGPTYSEHAHCWSSAGHIVKVIDLGSSPPDCAEVIIAVNPNNPNGYIHNLKDLTSLVRPDRLVIVDEAFADTQPDCSIIPATGQPGLIVLRSFGKFFGLAGTRLGFAVTDTKMANKISEALGPWPVTGPTLEIGTKAFSDTSWITETRLRLRNDANLLDSIVKPRLGPALGGTDLFRLYKTQDASIYNELAAKGILTRTFTECPATLRIGLPPSNNGFERLAKALF